jgi:hypothetical protein
MRTDAAGLETQHALDIAVPLQPRLELILHTRVRTQPVGLGFYQVRAGPILSWDVSRRFALLGGYYYAQQERIEDREFIAGHRLFGGTEFNVVESRRLTLDQRLLLERFLPEAAPDFNRYRFRTRLTLKAPVAPYLSHESFLDRKGWRSARHSAGIRWSLARHIQIDLGYLYEQRRMDAGGNRHLWLTSIHFKKTPRWSDPDL